jgi:hypothetical protein
MDAARRTHLVRELIIVRSDNGYEIRHHQDFSEIYYRLGFPEIYYRLDFSVIDCPWDLLATNF